MSDKKTLKEIKKERRCRRCGNNKGLIRKYNLMLCFRCFKEIAEKMGFRKYD
ncbi:MAG: 30S ribosomal protein S14 [Candidatus Diapherotrites archaeon]|nr:30S ribosomal protein S14 [Candidatus Diapherotrites archaeon]